MPLLLVLHALGELHQIVEVVFSRGAACVIGIDNLLESLREVDAGAVLLKHQV